MTDAVAAALAAARQVANNVPELAPPTAPLYPPAPLGVGRVKSLADAVETFVERPESFIKVDYYGIHIEDDAIISELFGELKLEDSKFPDVCRYTRAGTHDYLRTYDGVREVRSGKSWGQALDDAKRIDPKADIYPAVEFLLTLTKKPVKTGPSEKPAPEIGQKVGHTTSRTGFDPIMKFIRDAAKVYAPTTVIPVRVFHTPRLKGQNKWGVLGIEVAA